MFTVTKCFGRSETRVSDFNKQAEAEKFIQDKLQEDKRFKITATYRLYEGADLLQEFDQTRIVENASEGAAAQSETSGQSAGSRSSFAPTPFNTAPRPAGMPQNWGRGDEDKKGKV